MNEEKKSKILACLTFFVSEKIFSDEERDIIFDILTKRRRVVNCDIDFDIDISECLLSEN